eukprot:15450998-Alexandrium_andersonii.AAC.1
MHHRHQCWMGGGCGHTMGMLRERRRARDASEDKGGGLGSGTAEAITLQMYKALKKTEQMQKRRLSPRVHAFPCP